MMQKLSNSIKIQFSAGALICFAAILLLLPLQWVGAAILAGLIHELSHSIAILVLGGGICAIRIGGRGAVIEAEGISGVREIICALAGPIGSILLLAVAPRFPRTAICGVVHGIYNLLPLFPLDGGSVLRSLLFAFFQPPLAQKIMHWSQMLMLLLIIACCVLLSFRIGVMPIFLCLLTLGKIIRENPLANMRFWRYNRDTIDKEVRL